MDNLEDDVPIFTEIWVGGTEQRNLMTDGLVDGHIYDNIGFWGKEPCWGIVVDVSQVDLNLGKEGCKVEDKSLTPEQILLHDDT